MTNQSENKRGYRTDVSVQVFLTSSRIFVECVQNLLLKAELYIV